ncbi:MAG: (d)CMP kinase [Pirellulaceae bacterium]|nr:(d)CMP kinase [Pirellulaceae bacterium]
MIVTIDGPSGAGKSTVAKKLAQTLGFRYLDTGAMYRVLVLSAIRAEIRWENEEALVENCHNTEFHVEGDSIWLGDENVSNEIRHPEISKQIWHVADHLRIRELMVERQRSIASFGNYVCEGRDQGTVVFPKAERKVFLTANANERAKRRQVELAEKGVDLSLAEIEEEQNERDLHDYNRPVGRLVKADDAVEVVTDGMSFEQVVHELVMIVWGSR